MRLTRTGPKRLHLLCKYIFVKIQCIQKENRNTYTTLSQVIRHLALAPLHPPPPPAPNFPAPPSNHPPVHFLFHPHLHSSLSDPALHRPASIISSVDDDAGGTCSGGYDRNRCAAKKGRDGEESDGTNPGEKLFSTGAISLSLSLSLSLARTH